MRSAEEIAISAGLVVLFEGRLLALPPSTADVLAAIRAAQREAIEAAATAAKVAWLHYPRSEIGDADHDNDLCEFAETQIRALLPTDTQEPQG
jgi:hypothetical protein